MIAQCARLAGSHFNFFNGTYGQPRLAKRHAINPRINVRQHEVTFLIGRRARYLAIFLMQNHGFIALGNTLLASWGFWIFLSLVVFSLIFKSSITAFLNRLTRLGAGKWGVELAGFEAAKYWTDARSWFGVFGLLAA